MKGTRGRRVGGCKVAVLAIALIALSGAGYAQSLTATPPSVSFGNVPINMTSDLQSVTLTDLGTSPFTFTAAPILSGLNVSEFSIVPLPTGCLNGEVLAINGSCTISVSFTPTAIGVATATLSVPGAVGLNGVPLAITLSGTGVSPPIVVDANTVPCRNYKPHYTDIQTAINNAPSGATIVVCPGTYAQQITINKSVTLRGVTNTAANAGAAVIAAPPATATGLGLAVNFSGPFGTPGYAQVLVQASNVNIVDIAVDGTGALGPGCFNQELIGIGFDSSSSGALRRVALRNQNIPDGNGGYCGTDTPGYAGYGIFSFSTVGIAIQESSIRGFDGVGFMGEAPVPGGVGPSISSLVKTTVFNGVNGGASCIYVNSQSVQISNNTIGNCRNGLSVASGLVSPGQVTITGNTITNTAFGIVCNGCPGGTVSYNTIANTANSGLVGVPPVVGSSGTTFQYNDISGAQVGINLSLAYGVGAGGNTVSYNTINDANVGIAGVSGSTVSNNTFLNVTTLTAP